jgi:hypothetical protein
LNPASNQYVTSPFSSGLQLFQPLVPADGIGCNGILLWLAFWQHHNIERPELHFSGGEVLGEIYWRTVAY